LATVTISKTAGLDWMHWFNNERTHESIDDFTPVQVEDSPYRYRSGLTETG
jgi:putative transposase